MDLASKSVFPRSANPQLRADFLALLRRHPPVSVAEARKERATSVSKPLSMRQLEHCRDLIAIVGNFRCMPGVVLIVEISVGRYEVWRRTKGAGTN